MTASQVQNYTSNLRSVTQAVAWIRAADIFLQYGDHLLIQSNININILKENNICHIDNCYTSPTNSNSVTG
jgi:hypothetical protein